MEPEFPQVQRKPHSDEVKKLLQLISKYERRIDEGDWSEADQDGLEDIYHTYRWEGYGEAVKRAARAPVDKGNLLRAWRAARRGRIHKASEHLSRLMSTWDATYIQLRNSLIKKASFGPQQHRLLYEMRFLIREFVSVVTMARQNQAAFTYPYQMRNAPPRLLYVPEQGRLGGVENVTAEEIRAVLLSAMMVEAWAGGIVETAPLDSKLIKYINALGTSEERAYLQQIRDMRRFVDDFENNPPESGTTPKVAWRFTANKLRL
jgi:hypothetical protein